MIERYTRPEMGQIFTVENRFAKMLEVEVAVAKAQAVMKIIPKRAALEISRKAQFSIGRIQELEQTTKHDVIAFVSNVAENVGEMGRYLHFGMTSSDVLDTAFSLQVRDAGIVLQKGLDLFEKNLQGVIRKHSQTLCAGRTHGMFAEVTTFGFKMAGFLAEFRRNRERVNRALGQMMICKLSGAVGTYSSQDAEVERRVAKSLLLESELIATQVIPRDRHAEMILSLSMLASGLERLALEFRHLQRSEVAEVTEGFSSGQKGSSAMPHKKNPISAENVTGISRMLRGYASVALENVALWHERDISHSSAERVMFPDAFILADYAVHRMATLLAGLDVHSERMLENIELSQGQLFSSQVLLALVGKGFTRELAYRHVQRLCHSLQKGETLENKILKDSELKIIFKPKEVRDIFIGKRQKELIAKLVKKVL